MVEEKIIKGFIEDIIRIFEEKTLMEEIIIIPWKMISIVMILKNYI